MPKMRECRPLVERFNEKVDRSAGPDACHVWTAYRRRPWGYGEIQIGRRGEGTILAHRLAWISEHGEPMPETPFVLHRCDNPPCCNTRHHWLGTIAQNNADMRAKGRAHVDQRALPDHTIAEIREALREGVLQRVLAAQHGVSCETIARYGGTAPRFLRRACQQPMLPE